MRSNTLRVECPFAAGPVHDEAVVGARAAPAAHAKAPRAAQFPGVRRSRPCAWAAACSNQPKRAAGAMVADQCHGLREVGIAHGRHGDQQLIGQIAGFANGLAPHKRRRCPPRRRPETATRRRCVFHHVCRPVRPGKHRNGAASFRIRIVTSSISTCRCCAERRFPGVCRRTRWSLRSPACRRLPGAGRRRGT